MDSTLVGGSGPLAAPAWFGQAGRFSTRTFQVPSSALGPLLGLGIQG